MHLRTCDSCGGQLAHGSGGDVFFVVRLQITKGAAWGPVQTAAADRMAKEARRSGMKALADALDAGEPAEIIGDTAPKLVRHADLRICGKCIEQGGPFMRPDGPESGIDLLELVRASEMGTHVPTP